MLGSKEARAQRTAVQRPNGPSAKLPRPFRRFLGIGLVMALLAACSSPVDAPPVSEVPLVQAPAPTPTPLAVEASHVVTGNFYRPPSWDGVSDVDCSDFDTQAHAQSFFVGTRGSKTNDPYRLDSDHDGIACESLN